ncbi:MAG: hypothetical protein Edafosvirus1_123 [Edafosvirus sp.]|uniref:Uncharacterized protein n=1 Tax=Edafosvirus sp. TaxID=2487765 RepID=A0A3G4ZSA6_9VIRU|nr:MAG: hypothetical protein Edafosvirus1_123 [Edafosvirus sp.]
MSENKFWEKMVDCYACGDKIFQPMQPRNCLLCKSPQGHNNGQIYITFRKDVVKVIGEDGKEVVFIPPSYSCVRCKDTKKYKYWVMDPNVKQPCDGYITIGSEPEEMACDYCMVKQYVIDFKNAQKKYVK